MTRTLRRLAPVLLLGALALPAKAGLRPLYGGELVLTVPSAPQTLEPARAWSSSEVVLANALGARLSALLETPPVVSGKTVRLTPRADAQWPDGSAVDAKSLVLSLDQALHASPVALPPFILRVEGNDVVAELPYTLPDLARYFDLPWLRLVHAGDGGPFRARKGAVEADPNGLGGRAFTDRIRLDVREARKLDPAPEGLVLGRAGAEGRPVFALPRPGGPATAPLNAALAGLDRAALAKLFLRGVATVPDGWPLPPAGPKVVSPAPVVIAVDAGEHDLRTVAERLQVLLRDRNLGARIVAEDRAAYFGRLQRGDYDLALVALPQAPALVQAATLARLTHRKTAEQFWSQAAANLKKNARWGDGALREAAADAGAVLLYLEAGGVVRGARVRDLVVGAPWDVDLGGAWLAPAGTVAQ